jgi:polyferredoxin
MKFSDIELPSNRRFGFFFSAVFALAAAYFWYRGNSTFLSVFGGLLGATFLTTLIKPGLLLPFNKLWMGIGYVIGRIVSPIVLGVIFFILMTPMGVIQRLFGRDELRLKPQDQASHWKVRDPAGPEPASFKQQF